MLASNPTSRTHWIRRWGWSAGLILLLAGCTRQSTALQDGLELSPEFANSDPFAPPSPPLPVAAEVSDSPAVTAPPTLTDVTDAPVKILLDERSVPSGGKLNGEIRGHIPKADAIRLVWLDEWNRAVAHTEWAPPKAGPATPPSRFTLDLTAGLAPKGRKQRLVFIASEAKKGAAGEWKIWAESEFEISDVPAKADDVSTYKAFSEIKDPLQLNKIDSQPARTYDEIGIAQPADAENSTASHWYNTLNDIGYRPQVLKAANNWRAEKPLKVLVLPGIQKFSPEQLDVVRTYAESGTLILADRGAVGLEREFGMVREASAVPPGHATLMQRSGQKPLGLDSVDLQAAEAGLSIDTPKVTGRASLPPARAMGKSDSGAPVVLLHTYGNQRWIFLNLDFVQTLSKRTQPDESFRFPGLEPAEYAKRYGAPQGGEALRVLLSELLEEAAGKPEVQLKNADGFPVRNIWRKVTLEQGARRFWLSYSNPPAGLKDEAQPVRLVFPLSLYWYNPKTAKLLAHGTELATEVSTKQPTVLSALPYAVTGIKGKIRRLDSGGLLRIQLGIAREDNAPEPPPWVAHEFELSLRGPGGYELPQYLETVRTFNGAWDGQFKLALNDPVGDYKIIVRETYTGVKQEFVITKYECWYADLFPVKFAPLKDK